MPEYISLEEYWKLQKKGNKFSAESVTSDGITFQSKGEEKRYNELLLSLKSGQIRDLNVHAPRIEIIPAFIDRYKKKQRATYYIPDFSYWERDIFVIEDYKGGTATQTDVFKLKRKLVLLQYPEIDFRIVMM